MTLFVWEHTFRPWKFQKKCPNFLKKCPDFLCRIHKWINLRTDIFHASNINILQPAPVARSLIDGQITSQWHFPPKYLKHPVLLYPLPLPCKQSKASSQSQHFLFQLYSVTVSGAYILWDLQFVVPYTLYVFITALEMSRTEILLIQLLGAKSKD